MGETKLYHSLVTPGRHWWIGCLLAVLITGKGCTPIVWAAADKPSSEKAASSLAVLKLRDGLLTVQVTATPLPRVMSEISRLSGAKIVWLGQPDNSQVSADFTALPLSEALPRLLGPNNFLLMYASTAEEAKLTAIWVAPRRSVTRRPVPTTPNSTAMADDPAAVEAELERLVESHLDTALHGIDRDSRIEAIGFLQGFIAHDPRIRPLLEQLAADASDPQVRTAASEVLTSLAE